MANSQSTTSGTPADLEMRVAQFAARTIAVEPRSLQKLLAETDELVKIFHASVKTVPKNLALSEE